MKKAECAVDRSPDAELAAAASALDDDIAQLRFLLRQIFRHNCGTPDAVVNQAIARRCDSVNLEHPGVPPDCSGLDVPFPDADSCALRGQSHALIAVAQGGLSLFAFGDVFCQAQVADDAPVRAAQ